MDFKLRLYNFLLCFSAASYIIVQIFGVAAAVIAILYVIFYTSFWWLACFYLIWIFWIDNETPENGGRPVEWVKNWKWGFYVKEYFSLRLIKSEEHRLDPKRNYLFCCYPHGFLATSTFVTFGTNAVGIEKIYPDHRHYAASLGILFFLPFYRELLMSYSVIPATKKSLRYFLGCPTGGNIVGLAVGGAEEMLYCKSQNYKIILKKRKGFVKLALENGSPLVPVLAFGETELYEQIQHPLLFKLQTWMVDKFTMAVVFPLGLFNTIIPKRKPLTVIGKYKISIQFLLIRIINKERKLMFQQQSKYFTPKLNY